MVGRFGDGLDYCRSRGTKFDFLKAWVMLMEVYVTSYGDKNAAFTS